MNARTSGIVAVLLVCTLIASGPGRAGESEGLSPWEEAPELAATGPALGPTLDEDALAMHRGGQQDLYMNDVRSRASISNTATSQLQTGTNSIADGAFANSNGLPIAIQNSGNNVVIQNSTILNLQLK
jgi:hypothetical protein